MALGSQHVGLPTCCTAPQAPEASAAAAVAADATQARSDRGRLPGAGGVVRRLGLGEMVGFSLV